ncbi:MAG: hypothetical protein K2L93_03405 [Muribaculaceae bacterium]|nr:hypothetical protein [Muribaculaceae bacterium]
MKKVILFAAIIALMTACDGKKSSASSTESSASSEQSASSSSQSSASENVTATANQSEEQSASNCKWQVSPYDGGFESFTESTMYNGNRRLSLSSFAEITSDEVGIEEKGSGKGLYYAVSPTIKITEPVENVTHTTVALELLDETGSPIPYTYELAGKEYSSRYHTLSNDAALLKALKEGGECKLTFLIKPVDIVDFSTDMFDNAKYFVVSGTITVAAKN